MVRWQTGSFSRSPAPCSVKVNYFQTEVGTIRLYISLARGITRTRLNHIASKELFSRDPWLSNLQYFAFFSKIIQFEIKMENSSAVFEPNFGGCGPKICRGAE